jgi:hypothetical protein
MNLPTIHLPANNISIIRYLTKNNLILFDKENCFLIYFHIYLDPYRLYKVDRQLHQKGSGNFNEIQ